ncbi:MAG: hypothetical protein EOO14_03600 [Chitinophagaceae bacterium]|nr:MAG: hypothetical protein EOO14_03600 [Chitinophagaceae bacterium]
MKSFVIVFFLLVLSAMARAQKADSFNLGAVIGPGTRLVYEVVADTKLDLIMLVLDKNGGALKWRTTEPLLYTGTVLHTLKGLDEATAMYNYFDNSMARLSDQSLQFWISRKVFEHLRQQRGKPITMYPYGVNAPGLEMGSLSGPTNFEILVDGKPVIIQEQKAVALVKVDGKYVPAPGGEFFTVLADPDFRVLVNFLFDSRLRLKEVLTK